jgi:signal transduction histidine kinase
MVVPPLPANEPARLAALERYDILDTEREQAYDDFARLAAHICDTPIALISLIDHDRQWFKARLGMDIDETPREQAFCAHAIVDNATLVVGDALRDPRFEKNPLVTGDPRIRFYAGAPIVTGDGQGLGTLCVIDRVPRELSPAQRQALEALSRQLMAHLELRRALVALGEADQAKKKFVAHVSHELRTPLTSIRGALSLVLDGSDPLAPDARQLLGAAHRNADRLLALVNDLLDLERVGSGELTVDLQDADLAVAIDRGVDAVRPVAARAGVSIVAGPASFPIHADVERLAQVVINLLANAVRFSPPGGEIRVAAEQCGARVCVTIDDQGPGVPPAFRASIFEPFKQVVGSAAHKKGGTGLGLAISQAIVRKHGGTLVAGEAPGGGARFTIELPARSGATGG